MYKTFFRSHNKVSWNNIEFACARATQLILQMETKQSFGEADINYPCETFNLKTHKISTPIQFYWEFDLRTNAFQSDHKSFIAFANSNSTDVTISNFQRFQNVFVCRNFKNENHFSELILEIETLSQPYFHWLK